jgi:alpha-methylacyl-CoA racemase
MSATEPADGVAGRSKGPLAGVRVIEMAGLGPVPFAAMMLADHGAEVIRIDRRHSADFLLGDTPHFDVVGRSRRSITVDLKHPDGPAIVKHLAGSADILLEGYRPGVMERLGLAPDALQADNPALVYGRMTGWGQDGPLSAEAGHDINYIALAGLLHGFGPASGAPVPPANLVADYGGGGMMLAFAATASLWEARATGRGRVIDCAMAEGAGVLGSMIWGLRAGGHWQDRRAANLIDGGAPFYGCYETADGRFVAVGALEPAFYATLCDALGVADDPDFADQFDQQRWPAMRATLARVFRGRSRDQWVAMLSGLDVCLTPVLSLGEVFRHPHHIARDASCVVAGVEQPAPAPRYVGMPLEPPRPAPLAGADGWAVLAETGMDAATIERLIASGAVIAL